MSGIKDQHELDEMRKRLYSRGFDVGSERHSLSDQKVDVARNWGTLPPVISSPVEQNETTSKLEETADVEALKSVKKKHGYRTFILLGSIGIAAVAVLISGAFYLWGGNKISGENINFNLAGPATISGSETLSFQVGITNQNEVGIDNAVLVVKYPAGARTVADPIKNVYEERITIGTLNPGEVKNLQLQVGIYGKENEQQQIEATFEYKITGSDGTFYKVAEPLRFQIISSPIILQASAIGKVAAGQPVEVILTVKSNASKPMHDVLVSAVYPSGFSYKESDPKPIYNQNTWKIDQLDPEETVRIKIKGSITGFTQERFGINFSAGAAQTDNQFIVGSVLAETRTEFQIESPFIEVGISIDGDADKSVVLEKGKSSDIEISVTNTLTESVYDLVVEVVPSGNALQKNSIDSQRGYYDSNKGVIRWEVANNPDFVQVAPGASRKLNFTILPNEAQTAAAFDITVNVYARRVAEQAAQEQLVGTVKTEARYASLVSVTGQASYMVGPVPPRVGQTTMYLVTLAARAGSNDITNAVVTTSLPGYVEWLNEYSGPGSIDFNPVTKRLEWRVGDIDSGNRKELVFSVSILPSLSQVGITPVLANIQYLKATDRFTNTALSTEANPVTTELPTEAGYSEQNGTVIE